MLGDVSGYSNETTGRLLEISNLASGAIDDVHKTTDDLGQSADDMNSTMQSILDQGDTSVEELEDYVDSIEKSIDKVEDNLDNLSDDSKLSDSDKESIRSSIKGIRNNIDQFELIKNRDINISVGNDNDDDLDLDDLDDDSDLDDLDEDDPSAVARFRSAATATSDQAEAILAEVEKYVIKEDGDLWTAKEELKAALAERKTINRKDITLEGIRSYNERVKNSREPNYLRPALIRWVFRMMEQRRMYCVIVRRRKTGRCIFFFMDLKSETAMSKPEPKENTLLSGSRVQR